MIFPIAFNEKAIEVPTGTGSMNVLFGERADVRCWCLTDETSRAAAVFHYWEIEGGRDGGAASSLHHRRMRLTSIVPDVERQGHPRAEDLSLNFPWSIANAPSDKGVLRHPIIERLFPGIGEGLSDPGPDSPQRKSDLRGQ